MFKLSFYQRQSVLLCSKRHLSITRVTCTIDSNVRLGFIGVGKIAQAIILGLINKDIVKSEQIYLNDSNTRHLKYLKSTDKKFKDHKLNYCFTNEEIVKNATTVILAVKPNDINAVLRKISSKLTKNHLLMSLAAGIRLNQIRRDLPEDVRIIRVMTNIAALIQEGCSVYSKSENCTEDDLMFVEDLLKSIGTCEGEIDEELIDAVTALSSSGPAYMYVILDALADGALKMGMNKTLALRLATRTMHGAAAMVQAEKEKHIYQMKDEVCSPAGTTISGISELEKHRFRYALMKCVEMATLKAREMSQRENERNN